jgi:DNA mismatch endonuclease (patch repair protein)
MSSWASTPQVRRRMQAQRQRDTVPELAIRQILHSAGLRYRVDYRPVDTLKRRADIVFRRARVAVFVDGCFWHNCPQHRNIPATNSTWWKEKLEATKRRDRETDWLLKQSGWLPIRVWEHEDPVEAAAKIVEAISARITVNEHAGRETLA